MKVRYLLAAPLLLLLLAGCGSDKEDKDKAADKDAAAEEARIESKTMPICPQVAIIRPLDTYQDYGVEKSDPDQLVSAAKMTGVEGDCEYKDNGIDIAYKLKLTAMRGPRLGGLHMGFPFFVAVVDPSGTILNKDRMTAEIGFSSDSTTKDSEEPLHVFIPLDKHKRNEGPSYQVLMGFQLTEEQFKALSQQP